MIAERQGNNDSHFLINNLSSRLPITLMRNRGQEKESMRGASGFAEVELKLSTNAAHCETTQQRKMHMIVHFSRYLISTAKQLLNCLMRQVKKSSFSDCFKTVTLSVVIE